LSGLPFHNHGRTWIATIHGLKRWFIYPPGYNAPMDIDQKFPPTIAAWKWFNEYYPLLTDLPKPYQYEQEDFSKGFRPLECVQRPGDILFIPSLWSHMTLNIGETVGIGGQEALSTESRQALFNISLPFSLWLFLNSGSKLRNRLMN
jgi:hypothetical protein